MRRKPRPVDLTPLQIAHALVALRAHIAALNKQEDESSQGDEATDILIAESVIESLKKVADQADAEDYPNAEQPG